MPVEREPRFTRRQAERGDLVPACGLCPWGGLNLTPTMWLYRRMVITTYSPRTPRLTKEQFKNSLMSLSASGDYVEWLVGLQLSDRDRSPGYNRIKAIFAKRSSAFSPSSLRAPGCRRRQRSRAPTGITSPASWSHSATPRR